MPAGTSDARERSPHLPLLSKEQGTAITLRGVVQLAVKIAATRAAAAAIPGTADKVCVVSKRNFNPKMPHLAKRFHAGRFPQPEINRAPGASIEGFSGQAACVTC